MTVVIAAIAGLLFGLGLLVSGMADPHKVLGFLDLAGAWDPSLALVMGGAIAVALPGFALARQRGRSLLGEPMPLPPGKVVDAPLCIGSALFGIGWGWPVTAPGRHWSASRRAYNRPPFSARPCWWVWCSSGYGASSNHQAL